MNNIPNQPVDQLYQEFGPDLYALTGQEQTDSILDMISANPAANNASQVAVSGSDIMSGVSTGIQQNATGSQQAGKKTFDNTVTGYIIGVDPKDGLAKLYIGNATNYLNWTGTSLIVNGYVAVSPGTFGGNGTDGALAVASGTTNIDLGSQSIFIKNYTSISITGTGAITFTSPAAGGTLVILKSKGNVTITSAATRAIDLRSIGGANGTGGGAGGNQTGGGGGGGASAANAGTSGTGSSTTAGGGGTNASGFGQWIKSTAETGGAGSVNNGGAAAGGATPGSLASEFAYVKAICIPGSGGGGGNGGINGAGSAGGPGGGGLYIECAGALNFTGTIDLSGMNGTNLGYAAGSGGGGGAGSAAIGYNTLTANTGSFTVTGGVGGTIVGGANVGGTGGAGVSNVFMNTNFT